MSENTPAAEEKIIQAAVECIERYGISGATNRRIVEIAGVNIAAINYYFRSKEVLIQRVMEVTLDNAFDLGNIPPMPGASARERCTAIFLEILEGGIRYPNITRAHFHKLFVEGQQDTLLYEHVSRFIDGLAADLQNREPGLITGDLKLALMQIFSATVMAILTPSLIEQSLGLSLSNSAICRAYVARLVDKLL